MSQAPAAAPAASNAPRSATRRSWPSWVRYVLWALLGVLLALAVVTFVTVQFGAVHGVEFNPHSFARRSYSFYEVPIIRWQVRGIRREDVASDCTDFLQQNKYVASAKKAPDVWHVVVGTRGLRPPTDGDARILVTYLQTLNAEDQHQWVEWSKQNPNLAPLLWSAVGRLAQEELYIYVPELFELASTATDPVAFQQKLDQQLAVRWFEIGLRLQEQEDHAAAKKYLAEAAKLDGSNPLVKRALERSAASASP